MSAEVAAAAADMCCSSCGQAEIDDVKLKKCDGGCDLVKYCNDGCQKEHRSKHKKACKKRLAELRDNNLFTPPEGSHRGECPICCLPQPIDPTKSTDMPCCSKLICHGCCYANQNREHEAGLEPRCPFCREPLPKSLEESDKHRMKRIKENNDPAAMRQVGKKRYHEGDYDAALHYFTKAAELGDAEAHFELSCLYHDGHGVEKDAQKKVYHTEQAAIGGHPTARHNLGFIEYESGRFDRAKKHFIIAANLGYHGSLKGLRQLYKEGYASEEDYDAARCAYQAAVEATKSPEREEGEAYYEAREAAQHK